MIGRRPAGSQIIEGLSIIISILEETRTFKKCITIKDKIKDNFCE